MIPSGSKQGSRKPLIGDPILNHYNTNAHLTEEEQKDLFAIFDRECFISEDNHSINEELRTTLSWW